MYENANVAREFGALLNPKHVGRLDTRDGKIWTRQIEWKVFRGGAKCD